MKRRLVVVALSLAAISAACSPGTVGTAVSEAEKKHRISVSPVEDPRLVLGETATTSKDGNTLTVFCYESPLSVEGAKPDPGFEFSTIEVEGCAGSSSGEDLMYVGSNAFSLRSPDGTRVQPEGFGKDEKVREPALRTMDPVPGACERGFVTFQTPRGERPHLVVFEEQFVLDSAIAWKVTEEQ